MWLKYLYRLLRFETSYLNHPRWDTGIVPPEIVDFINSHAPGRLLDLGCGTATNLIAFARAGWQAVGIDFSWLAIYHARKKIRSAGLPVQLHWRDVTNLRGVSGQFDLILDMGCFHKLPHQQRIVYQKNLKQYLTPEGVFLMYAHCSSADHPLSGVREDDLETLGNILQLVNRVDTFEPERGPSVWVQFMNKPKSAE